MNTILFFLSLFVGTTVLASEHRLVLDVKRTQFAIEEDGKFFVKAGSEPGIKVRDYVGYSDVKPDVVGAMNQTYVKSDASGKTESLIYSSDTKEDNLRLYYKTDVSIDLKDGKVVSQMSCDYKGGCRVYTKALCDNILAASSQKSWAAFQDKVNSCSEFADSYLTAFRQPGMNDQIQSEFENHVKKLDGVLKVGAFKKLFGALTPKYKRQELEFSFKGNEVANGDMEDVYRICGQYGVQKAWNEKALPGIPYLGRNPVPAPAVRTQRNSFQQ